jgi:hypothetical protein
VTAPLSPPARAAFEALWRTLRDEAMQRELDVAGVVAVVEALRDELQRRVRRMAERQPAHVEEETP